MNLFSIAVELIYVKSRRLPFYVPDWSNCHFVKSCQIDEIEFIGIRFHLCNEHLST